MTAAGDGRALVTVEGRFVPRHRALGLMWPVLGHMLARLARGILAELEVFVGQTGRLGQ